MIYEKIFIASGLSSYEIRKRLGIGITQYQQFLDSKTINLERIVKFCKLLNVNPKEVAEVIRKEIINEFKK